MPFGEPAQFQRGEAGVAALSRTGFELRPQREHPFADSLARNLTQAREQLGDRNPESGFAGEGRPQGRQAPALFVARHLRPVPATHQKSYLRLGETGALAVGPQVVFEFVGCHRGRLPMKAEELSSDYANANEAKDGRSCQNGKKRKLAYPNI